MKGIDISTHNSISDYGIFKKCGYDFAIIRAGFGNTIHQKDAKFDKHMKECIKAGMQIGVYWFSYADSVEDAKTEANVCLDVIAPYKDNITLPVFFDFEYASAKYLAGKGVSVDKDFVTNVTKAFCDKISSNGYQAGYYTNLDYYRNYYNHDFLKKYKLWLADWDSAPEYDCFMWQNSSKGIFAGCNGYVDINQTVNTTNKAICTGNSVRLRAQPHTEADILDVLNKGDKVVVLDDDGWGWSKVKYEGKTGWMFNKYLSVDGSSPKTVYIQGDYVNVRSGHGKNFPVLRQLFKGDTETLVSIGPSKWLDVGTGYIYYDKNYIEVK